MTAAREGILGIRLANADPSARAPVRAPPLLRPPRPRRREGQLRALTSPTMPSRAKTAAVAALVAGLAAGASAADHRKLQQPYNEGELLATAGELVTDLEFADFGGIGLGTFDFLIGPIASALDAPLGYVLEPVYQFVGTNVPGFGFCAE